MIGFVFIFGVLAFQQKKAAFPAESAEHKFLITQRDKNNQAAVDAFIAWTKCGATDECDRAYEPVKRKLNAEADLINAQLPHVDECKKTYRTTIDKKTSDLTVRETTAVNACQALDLYPFKMPTQARKQP